MLSSKRTELNFGTSGLRALATSFTQENISAYIEAFLGNLENLEKTIYIGADLRPSSPTIAANVISAINNKGWQTIYAGNVPTPALAFYAIKNNCPSIMITGSHIPKNYNGIKFYHQKGELLKEDEALIHKKAISLMNKVSTTPFNPLPKINNDIAQAYITRFTSAFPKDMLKGLKLGVDMHSAVGSNLLVEIITNLGAACFPFHYSKEFIAIDTETLDKKHIKRAKIQLKKHNLDAIISTDADGDRPLLIDENGIQVNGDILGAICAKFLGVDIVITPISSTTAIEKSGWFNKTIRTKVGSPYVILAMKQERKSNSIIAGFEANGGFLLASDIDLPNGNISKLPTRDAVLPLLVILSETKKQNISISNIVKSLPPLFMKTDKITGINFNDAQIFLSELLKSEAIREAIHIHIRKPQSINRFDGVRMSFSDGSIVHFRQSGNAPEIRCYVETNKQNFTNKLLSEIINNLKKYFTKRFFINE